MPHARYFVTLATIDRRSGLSEPSVATKLKHEITAIEQSDAWSIHAAVIMPDHLHLLFTLQERLTLGQTIARLKSKTRTLLDSSAMHWQGNYYEHRLRPDDPLVPVIRYLFLNPYRAKLLRPDQTYPWFWLGEAETEWFQPMTDDGSPFPEWLGE